MDVESWGATEHALHAQVTPVRAAEYRLPVFRLASSGISQWVSRQGRVLASAPYPGPGAAIAGDLALRGPGRLPWDRVLAPACVAFTGGFVLWLGAERLGFGRPRKANEPSA
jgi:apolipoprotein N-acyltransferase